MTEETKHPLVSVIMPCYKMGQFIGEALQSVGKQTYTNWEVIAVDDCGPEDGTREAVEGFAKQFPNHRVIYHRHEKNGGVSAARNTAIGLAQGEYLAFLDPDDAWFPRKLEMQIQLLSHNPGSVSVFTFGEIKHSETQTGYWTGRKILGRVQPGLTSYDFYSIASGGVLFPFSSFLCRKESICAAGFFQENLPFQNEDRLLVAKIAQKGESLLGILSPLCYYRVHDFSATTAVIEKKLNKIVEYDLLARIIIDQNIKKNRDNCRKLVKFLFCSYILEIFSNFEWLRVWKIVCMHLLKVFRNNPSLPYFLAKHSLYRIFCKATARVG